MLLFDVEMLNTGEKINNTYLESLIKVYPKTWQKAWVESMRINESRVKETDILEILFNIIERFCQMLEDEYEMIISFDRYIEAHDEYQIVNWNTVLHHVQIGKPYKQKIY